jgi:hypothetical protein
MNTYYFASDTNGNVLVSVGNSILCDEGFMIVLWQEPSGVIPLGYTTHDAWDFYSSPFTDSVIYKDSVEAVEANSINEAYEIYTKDENEYS